MLVLGLVPEPRSEPVTHPILVPCGKRTSLISRLGCGKPRLSNWSADGKLPVVDLQQGQPFLELPSPDHDGVLSQFCGCAGQLLICTNPKGLVKWSYGLFSLFSIADYLGQFGGTSFCLQEGSWSGYVSRIQGKAKTKMCPRHQSSLLLTWKLSLWSVTHRCE